MGTPVNSSASRKVTEGTEALRQAEKCLKTGLLKWKPDFDNAANEYSKAATCFKAGKALDQCKDAHLRSADCYLKNGSFFACAKIVEAKFPEIAVGFFNRAAEIVSVEDRPRQSAEFCGHAVRLLLKLARWDEAADAVSRQKQLLAEAQDDRAVGRLVVALVLVHLARDDFVAASKAVDYDKGFLEAQELDTLSCLLKGYDEGDPDMVTRALNAPFLRHMDTEYAKLARMLGQQVAESAKKTASESKPSAEAVGDAKDVDNGTVDRPEQDHLEVPDSTTAAESDDEFAGGLL
ncbi:gamma-soluble NSF attachment protein isoform X2 [Rhipicephalus microplus]|uniref:gamma-soluble NSF attachment protein isoform X2 n=1 Tax=Rhipicephalus microplus TaxID=6941 RepID=UPI0018895F6A|nr:gamma-soluble NSF attachment protein-like isoform X2 [Rhipicephalus microplus]